MAAEESGCKIELGELPVINCDRSQFIRLFQNLLSNAIKFRSKEDLVVKIDAEKKKGNWIISVRDNGIGIPEEYHDKIFVIFKKLHHRDDYPGTGIGLALCKKIMERHNGRIWVESNTDIGSTFYISLPISKRKDI